jgi:8-oxo-dGTP pyrophosphatase MutT (NUDIX family)
MTGDYSLVILKPDLIHQKLETYLTNELQQVGIIVLDIAAVRFDLEMVRIFYSWETVKHPIEISSYLCTSPMYIWLVHGAGAIVKMLAIKKKMRGIFPTDALHSLLHCSDSHEDFLRELRFVNTHTERPMKTNNQVEVIVFRRLPSKTVQFLMLKRNEKKGGFWQPITGNVEGEETFEEAATRETREEVGITDFVRLVDTGYSFNFFDDGRDQHERVFGIEVSPESAVTLSGEHTAFVWASEEECLYKYLKYPGNKEGLQRLVAVLVPK